MYADLHLHSTLNEYDAVDVIKAAGGISVIAHPRDIEDDSVVMQLILIFLLTIEFTTCYNLSVS